MFIGKKLFWRYKKAKSSCYFLHKVTKLDKFEPRSVMFTQIEKLWWIETFLTEIKSIKRLIYIEILLRHILAYLPHQLRLFIDPYIKNDIVSNHTIHHKWENCFISKKDIEKGQLICSLLKFCHVLREN